MTPTTDERPLGAVENGRVFIEQENWPEVVRCFEAMAEWIYHGSPPVSGSLETTAEERADLEEDARDGHVLVHAEVLALLRDFDRLLSAPASGEADAIAVTVAMEQWERSTKRPDLTERDRVRGALETYGRSVLAKEIVGASPVPASLMGGDGWNRDMESAPRDGTAIIAAVPVYSAQTKQFLHWDRHIVWFDPDAGAIDVEADAGWAWDDYTHWCHLPAAPASPSGAK